MAVATQNINSSSNNNNNHNNAANKVNLTVVCRLKPDNEDNEETKQNDNNNNNNNLKPKWNLDSNTISIYPSRGGRKPLEFEFDKILPPSTSQEEAFDSISKSVIADVLCGYNSTIFCYGQTSSGKTHTIFGKEGSNDPTLLGLLPRCVAYCIHCIKESVNVVEASITISCIEIYQEQLKDLISPSTSSKLKIKISPNGETYVENLTQRFMQSSNDALKMIEVIKLNRTKISKNSKYSSSRSNCLACLTIKQKMSNSTSRKAKCYFGDLAGSEDIIDNDDTHNNDDLNTLRLVIHSLSAKKSSIPYNNSALTTILRDSLGGNTKTTIIVTCSMHLFKRDETINSLRFGQRARLITNNIKLNRELSRNEMKKVIDKQELQIQSLQLQLKQLLISSKPSVSSSQQSTDQHSIDTIGDDIPPIDTHDECDENENDQNDQIKELKIKYDKLQHELTSQKSKYMAQNDKYQDLESNYHDIKNKYQQLQNQYNLQSQNNTKQQNEIQSLKSQITNSLATNDNLKYKINDLSQKNTQLQAISNTILS